VKLNISTEKSASSIIINAFPNAFFQKYVAAQSIEFYEIPDYSKFTSCHVYRLM
jgi:hypothetical protein